MADQSEHPITSRELIRLRDRPPDSGFFFRMASHRSTWRRRRTTWTWCSSYWTTAPVRASPPRLANQHRLTVHAHMTLRESVGGSRVSSATGFLHTDLVLTRSERDVRRACGRAITCCMFIIVRTSCFSGLCDLNRNTESQRRLVFIF